MPNVGKFSASSLSNFIRNMDHTLLGLKLDNAAVSRVRTLARRFGSFLLLVAFVVAPPLAGQDISSKVDKYMNAQVGVNRFSGSILLAQSGKVLVSKEYGVAAMGADPQTTRETRFHLGSVTTQITAMAILQLQEKGKLDVQDSVCRYLTKCPNDWREIKIFNLLTHTSGIPDLIDSSDYENTKAMPATGQELLARLEAETLEFKPGERFKYSYSGYEVLAAVIENASGEPYMNYLKEHMFDPLGMRNTGYDNSMRIPSRLGPGFGGKLALLTPSDLQMSLLYRAGGLYSNVEDLYRWDRALLTEKLVSRKSLMEMSTPFRDGYGFGWVIRKEFSRKLITQGGGINILSASIRRYPDDDACIIVLSNLENADAGRIGHDLAAILFGQQYEFPKEHQAIKLDPAIYDNFVGLYALAPNFTVTVTREGDRLMIRGTGQEKIEIFPESETRFFGKGLGAEMNFVKNAKGHVTQLVLQQGGGDVAASKFQ
jgi:CubicO group peptidase (beta-lactamase class C family)